MIAPYTPFTRYNRLSNRNPFDNRLYRVNGAKCKPGAAANNTAQYKIDKYAKLASTHIFYPFDVETAGTWHHMAIELTTLHYITLHYKLFKVA